MGKFACQACKLILQIRKFKWRNDAKIEIPGLCVQLGTFDFKTVISVIQNPFGKFYQDLWVPMWNCVITATLKIRSLEIFHLFHE